MTDTLGKRVYRDYCWFALVLLALLMAYADRLLPSTEAGDKVSSGAVQAPRGPGDP